MTAQPGHVPEYSPTSPNRLVRESAPSPAARFGLLRYLIQNGLADPTALHDPRVRIESRSRSHAVWLVRLPEGQNYVVKRAIPRTGEPWPNLGSEILIYQSAGDSPELRHLLPTCFHADDRLQVLVLEAVEPCETVHTESYTRGPSAERLRALGYALGQLHRATRAGPVQHLPDSSPWILDVLSPGSWKPPHADTVLAQGAIRRELAAHFTRLTSQPAIRCLVHNDLKWDNCLIAGNAVKIIDWELASTGDPAWDVAGILQEFDVYYLSLPATPGTHIARTAFLDAYLDAAQPDDRSGFVQWARRMSGARLIQTALEYTAVAPDTGFAYQLIERGLSHLRGAEGDSE
jgi:tRNA A-37 threonylcarbamoyl transferase component Bud32